MNVTGGEDLTLIEFEEIMKIITANADDDALIISGTAFEEMPDDRIKVIVIAAGFDSGERKVKVSSQKNENMGDIIPYDE